MIKLNSFFFQKPNLPPSKLVDHYNSLLRVTSKVGVGQNTIHQRVDRRIWVTMNVLPTNERWIEHQNNNFFLILLGRRHQCLSPPTQTKQNI